MYYYVGVYTVQYTLVPCIDTVSNQTLSGAAGGWRWHELDFG